MHHGLVPPTTSFALAVTLALGAVLLDPDARDRSGDRQQSSVERVTSP